MTRMQNGWRHGVMGAVMGAFLAGIGWSAAAETWRADFDDLVRGAAKVIEAAADKQECLALALGDEGQGEAGPWRITPADHRLPAGRYRLEAAVRLHLPPDFDASRLDMVLRVADGQTVHAELPFNWLLLDHGRGLFTTLSRDIVLADAFEPELRFAWRIAELPAHEIDRPARDVVAPSVSDAIRGSDLSIDPPGPSDGLADLTALLLSDIPVSIDEIDYPALLLDRFDIVPVANDLWLERVRAERVHVAPGEANPVTVTVRNDAGAARTADLVVRIRSGLDDEDGPQRASLSVPAGGTAQHRFEWIAGSREFGHAAHVELWTDGRLVHAAEDMFSVSRPVWKTAIQGPGFITWHGREHQFPGHVAENRRHYVNVEEAFSWQPCSWTDLTPTNTTWWTGQNNFHNSLNGLETWMELSHAEGIKMITYSWATASGPHGVEFARRYPDLITHHDIGLASEFHDIEDLRLYDRTRAHPELWPYQYGVWHSFGINRGFLRLIDMGADELIASARRFGWNGVRFDTQLTWGAMSAETVHEEFRRMGIEALMQTLVPEYYEQREGTWSARAISTRNMRYMKYRLREALGDDFAIASNYGPVPPPGTAPEGGGVGFDYVRDFCAGGTQLNMEYFRHARGWPTWSGYAAELLRQVELTRRAGGYHAVQTIDKPGPQAGVQYNHILLFAVGSHPYAFREPRVNPGRYARFMTRYGEFCWDPRLEPVSAGDSGLMVADDDDLWWRPFLKRRVLDDGRAQTIMHVITPPPEDALPADTFSPMRPWRRSIRVSQAADRIPDVWLLSAEPDVRAESLTVTRADERFAVTIPQHRIWSLLVWTEGGGE